MTHETIADQPPATDRGVKFVEDTRKSGKEVVRPGLVAAGLKEPEYELVACESIDWLTATTNKEDIGHTWMKRYDQLQKLNRTHELEIGHKKWQQLGYRGYSTVGMRVGFSEKAGWIVILSGSVANQLWRLFVPKAKITRVDLAVTVKLGVAMEDVSRAYYRHLGGNGQLVPKRALIQNSDGGQTFYLGSRKSQSFGRVYDKGREQKSSPAGFKWRYEVEYKKPKSQAMAHSLEAVSEKDQGAILRTVYEWFDYRGVTPLFRSNGVGLQADVEARVTTVDKKIAWLRSQVRPTVQYLLSCGRREDTVDALGLAETGLTGQERPEVKDGVSSL